jgi:transcriptional regulator with XRE-family HTH domain
MANSGPATIRDIDKHVGAQIRKRRVTLGHTQQDLAKMLGVTYQQAHKYERGLNRVSAGRLYKVAMVLGVPIDYFYDGLDIPGGDAPMPHQRMCLELARNFTMIQNERHQLAISDLARALAAVRPEE